MKIDRKSPRNQRQTPSRTGSLTPEHVAGRLPRPLVPSGRQRQPSVRHRYLSRLGYTPLRFERIGSPSFMGHGTYNPNMTPPTVLGRRYGSFEMESKDRLMSKKKEKELRKSRSFLRHLEPGRTVSSTFNLLGATVGAGALALPYAFKLIGVLGGTITLVVSAILCVYTIRLLISCRDSVQLCSYEDLTQHCFGKKFAVFVEWNIIIFCFGTCVAYLIAIGDIVCPIAYEILHESGYEWLSRRSILITTIGMGLMAPLSAVESVTELRFANMFGIFVFMALVLGVAYKGVPELINQDFDPPYLLAGEGTTWGVLSALPMVMYSYCCHINVFSIYTELQRPSIRKMSNVVLLSCGVASVLYVVLAITGLSQFRNETKEDILSNLGHREPVMGGLQILMAINIGLGFPMNVYPSRFTIEMLFFPDAKPSLSRRYTITGVFVGLAVIIAVYLPKISTVFSILGASSAVLVSFTLPSGFYVYIRTGSVVSLNEISASLLFIASLIFGILATTASVVSSISPNVIEK